jgi:hypothetical protein
MTVRAALETLLNTMSPSLATAWENVAYEPVIGTAYQQVNLLLASPENPEMNGAGYREIGFMQITLKYPLANGPGDADSRAAALRTTFARGTSATSGSTTVVINKTPSIGVGVADGDRWSVAVRIPFFCNQF